MLDSAEISGYAFAKRSCEEAEDDMKGIKEPHIFRVSSNPQSLVTNLAHLLAEAELDKIRAEIRANVRDLFFLGNSHFQFARRLGVKAWRQKVSRLYYAAYNMRRAINLCWNGSFSTDSSDHKELHKLPDELPNVVTYRAKLVTLREDRNLCDYNHLAKESHLVMPISECLSVVTEFRRDAKSYLKDKGVLV